MIKSIRHIGIVVQNMEEALDFWCDVLGFCVAKKLEEFGPHIDAMLGMDEVRLTTAKLAAPDGNLVELLHFHSHSEKPIWSGKLNSTGFTHVAMTVDNLDSMCEMLSEKGFSCLSSPQFSPDGYAKVVFVVGPEGILLEFVEVLAK